MVLTQWSILLLIKSPRHWYYVTNIHSHYPQGLIHDDVIKWKHFPRYWPFVRGIHRFPVNSSHKGQWRGALTFTLMCARINSWVNDREAGDLRRHCAHYDVIVMILWRPWIPFYKRFIGPKYKPGKKCHICVIRDCLFMSQFVPINELLWHIHHCDVIEPLNQNFDILNRSIFSS